MKKMVVSNQIIVLFTKNKIIDDKDAKRCFCPRRGSLEKMPCSVPDFATFQKKFFKSSPPLDPRFCNEGKVKKASFLVLV